MQAEINAIDPPMPVRLLGVNEVGFEEDNEDMCFQRDLAWLQDTEADNVWAMWGSERWDVFILDDEGLLVEIYDVSLENNQLGDPANYNELMRILLELAGE